MRTDTLFVESVGRSYGVELFVKTTFVQDAKKKKDF